MDNFKGIGIGNIKPTLSFDTDLDNLNHKFLQSSVTPTWHPLNLVIEITVILFLVLIVSASAMSLNEF